MGFFGTVAPMGPIGKRFDKVAKTRTIGAYTANFDGVTVLAKAGGFDVQYGWWELLCVLPHVSASMVILISGVQWLKTSVFLRNRYEQLW